MQIVRLSFTWMIYVGILFAVSSCGSSTNQADQPAEMEQPKGKAYTAAYVCPMHCEGSGSEEPGKCPVCDMAYVQNKDNDSHDHDHGDHDGHDHDHEGHNH